MKKFFEIFKIFFIVGLQLIGGGYVIFPLLKKYLVEDKKWLKEEELTDYLALSQCLPGIIALNISIFSGWKLGRFLGAVSAIFGLLLPSYIIILVLSEFIVYTQGNKLLSDIFFGVRLSVIVLLSSMIYNIFKQSLKSLFFYAMFFGILIFVFFGVTPTVAVISGILISILRGRKHA